jgi:hypothetical protein
VDGILNSIAHRGSPNSEDYRNIIKTDIHLMSVVANFVFCSIKYLCILQVYSVYMSWVFNTNVDQTVGIVHI